MILYINVWIVSTKILWYFSTIEGEYTHAASKCFHKYITDGQFINKYIFALHKIYMKSCKLSHLKSSGFKFQCIHFSMQYINQLLIMSKPTFKLEKIMRKLLLQIEKIM